MQCFRNAAIASLAVSLTAIAAQAAPQQALNKTVVVTYAMFTPAKGADGSTNSTARNVTHQIYISTQGRMFVKNIGRAGNYSGQSLRDPSSGSFSFAGNTIVGTVTGSSNGANRITVTFDASYQSCSASVIAGTQSNVPFTWVALNGVRYTATGKTSISGINCTVSQGNAFAG